MLIPLYLRSTVTGEGGFVGFLDGSDPDSICGSLTIQMVEDRPLSLPPKTATPRPLARMLISVSLEHVVVDGVPMPVAMAYVDDVNRIYSLLCGSLHSACSAPILKLRRGGVATVLVPLSREAA